MMRIKDNRLQGVAYADSSFGPPPKTYRITPAYLGGGR